MTFLFRKELDVDVTDERTSKGPETGFTENFNAALTHRLDADSSNSRYMIELEIYESLIDALNQELAPGQKPFRGKRGLSSPQKDAWRLFAEVQRRRDQDPNALPGQPASEEDVVARVRERVKRAIKDQEDVTRRQSLGGLAGEVAGGVFGALQDPVDVALIPLGGGGGFARVIATEAVLGAAAEAIVGASVSNFRRDLDLPYSKDQYMQRIAYGALFGGLIGGGIASVKPVARKVVELSQLGRRELADEVLAKSPKPEPDERGAAAELHREQDIVDDAGRDMGGAEEQAHIDRVNTATERAALFRAVDAGTGDLNLFTGELTVGEHAYVQQISPHDLSADAKAFQFKGGGNADGVTDALRGVTRWDAGRAGITYVWQRLDGKKFIADGHQRLGLAKRLAADGQEVELNAFVFREEDGWTPENLRVIAALKNIAEGSGSAVDAAKVLRGFPEGLDGANLPPRSALVRHARDLVALDDDAFMMVVNGVVPENYAALLGRLVHDDVDLQRAIMGLLARSKPENLTQAEALIRQGMDAGLADGGTADLLGGLGNAESLAPARAKVLDAVLKELKRDKSVFSTLIREKGRIAETGQQVDAATSKAVADVASQAIQQLQLLVNRKGGLSDALNFAARQYRDSGNLKQPVRDFIDSVRSSVERGDFAGDGLGSDRGRVSSAREGSTSAGGAGQSGRGPGGTKSGPEQSLDLFNGPDADGPSAQTQKLEADMRQELDAEASLGDIPTGERIDPETGDRVADTRDPVDLLDEIESEKSFLDDVVSCRKGGN